MFFMIFSFSLNLKIHDFFRILLIIALPQKSLRKNFWGIATDSDQAESTFGVLLEKFTNKTA